MTTCPCGGVCPCHASKRRHDKEKRPKRDRAAYMKEWRRRKKEERTK